MVEGLETDRRDARGDDSRETRYEMEREWRYGSFFLIQILEKQLMELWQQKSPGTWQERGPRVEAEWPGAGVAGLEVEWMGLCVWCAPGRVLPQSWAQTECLGVSHTQEKEKEQGLGN